MCGLMFIGNLVVLCISLNARRIEGRFKDTLHELDKYKRNNEDLKGFLETACDDVKRLTQANIKLRRDIETLTLTTGIDTTNAQE